MGTLIAVFSMFWGIFILAAIWRVVMDLPNILLELKGIRQLLIDIEKK